MHSPQNPDRYKQIISAVKPDHPAPRRTVILQSTREFIGELNQVSVGEGRRWFSGHRVCHSQPVGVQGGSGGDQLLQRPSRHVEKPFSDQMLIFCRCTFWQNPKFFKHSSVANFRRSWICLQAHLSRVDDADFTVRNELLFQMLVPKLGHNNNLSLNVVLNFCLQNIINTCSHFHMNNNRYVLSLLTSRSFLF